MAKMGTMSDVARELGISRNAVSRQVKNRDRTGAPLPDDTGLFDIDGYRKWYVEDFHPRTGPRRGVKAKEKLTQSPTV